MPDQDKKLKSTEKAPDKKPHGISVRYSIWHLTLNFSRTHAEFALAAKAERFNLKCSINMTTVTLVTKFIYTFVDLRHSGEAINSSLCKMRALGNTRKLYFLSVALLLVDLLYFYKSTFMQLLTRIFMVLCFILGVILILKDFSLS